MASLPTYILLAFDKNNDEPLSQDELEICEEWTSGRAEEYLKIDLDDPRLFEYLGLYIKCEKNKEELWKALVNGWEF
jgi:hypothetical protein